MYEQWFNLWLYCWHSILPVEKEAHITHHIKVALTHWNFMSTVLYYYCNYYLSNSQRWQCTKVEEQVAYHYAGQLAEMGDYFRHNMYVCILCLRCEDDMLVILCMGLPITTISADEWLNSLICHDDIKCITTNRWFFMLEPMIYLMG